MATDALTPCLPGSSDQVFVRCLQIPTLVIVNGLVFERSGIGPQQEGGGGFQTHKIRGGAIRANAWLGALGLGEVGHVWVTSMGVGMMNTVEKNNQTQKKDFDLSQPGVGLIIPISRLPPIVFIR